MTHAVGGAALQHCGLLFCVEFNIFVLYQNDKEMDNSLCVFVPSDATAFMIRTYRLLPAE